jgi:hypothetical protein
MGQHKRNMCREGISHISGNAGYLLPWRAYNDELQMFASKSLQLYTVKFKCKYHNSEVGFISLRISCKLTSKTTSQNPIKACRSRKFDFTSDNQA